MAEKKINILSQYLKTNNEAGYVVFDIDTAMSADAFNGIKNIEGTVKARMLY